MATGTKAVDIIEIRKALSNYPYFVLREEAGSQYKVFRDELEQIQQKYIQYKKGVMFYVEGTSGDYVASDIPFKESSTLINKIARFMFSRTPDFVVQAEGTSEEEQRSAQQYQKMLREVLKNSGFSGNIIKAAKDCLIGKRVAILVDYSEMDGMLIHFYDSRQFYYERESANGKLTKFVSFENINRSASSRDRRILVNKYYIANNVVRMSAVLYDGSGKEIEVLVPDKEIEFSYIPAVVVTNDGTLEDVYGTSDMDILADYEAGYSRLANSDIDSDRKGMNPVRYTVDMNPDTTSSLPSGPGAYWDLQSNQNMNDAHPSVGVIAPAMNHTEAVKTSLDRIKTSMYQGVDVPNISEETMVGSVTSGKALKALYWPLMVRCDEKLKYWIPALEYMARAIVDYARLEKNNIVSLYVLEGLDEINMTVHVRQHYALLDDEEEQKASDLSEIAQNTRSRRSYLKKWRKEEFKTDEQANKELMQIAVELNMFDTMSMNTQVQSNLDQTTNEENVDKNLERNRTQQTLGGE